ELEIKIILVIWGKLRQNKKEELVKRRNPLMNQQEIFEYIKKQYPANPERITQNGKQSTIFKTRETIFLMLFFINQTQQ
ncbi:MAG: hypothetical protein ACLTS6_08655, partial [Anaerobutyricum sp.]